MILEDRAENLLIVAWSWEPLEVEFRTRCGKTWIIFSERMIQNNLLCYIIRHYAGQRLGGVCILGVNSMPKSVERKIKSSPQLVSPPPLILTFLEFQSNVWYVRVWMKRDYVKRQIWELRINARWMDRVSWVTTKSLQWFLSITRIPRSCDNSFQVFFFFC